MTRALLDLAEKTLQEHEEFLNEAKQAVEVLRRFLGEAPTTANGNGHRTRLPSSELGIQQLKRSPQTVKQLQHSLKMSPSAIASMLGRLRRKGVVESRGGVWALKSQNGTRGGANPKVAFDGRKEKILSCLRENGPITVNQLHQKSRIYTRMESYYTGLNQLLKSGKVVHEGNTWSVK